MGVDILLHTNKYSRKYEVHVLAVINPYLLF